MYCCQNALPLKESYYLNQERHEIEIEIETVIGNRNGKPHLIESDDCSVAYLLISCYATRFHLAD